MGVENDKSVVGDETIYSFVHEKNATKILLRDGGGNFRVVECGQHELGVLEIGVQIVEKEEILDFRS